MVISGYIFAVVIDLQDSWISRTHPDFYIGKSALSGVKKILHPSNPLISQSFSGKIGLSFNF